MQIEDFSAANAAMIAFWIDVQADLSEMAKELLQGAITNVIAPASVSNFTEIVYANREAFSASQLAQAADVAEFATFHRFYGLGDDMRGAKITATLRGDDVPGDAPAIKDSMVFPVPPEEPAEA